MTFSYTVLLLFQVQSHSTIIFIKIPTSRAICCYTYLVKVENRKMLLNFHAERDN